MRLPRLRFTVRWNVAMAVSFGLSLALIASRVSMSRAQELASLKDLPTDDERNDGPHRPLSAPVARTWIALHEAKIRPLPDHTPLRQVLQALRDATRGKAGWTDGIRFRVASAAMDEAEITLDSPAALTFVGRTEVSVDMYMKYLLRQFAWERYVGAGAVVIDSPCDDCVGYETVGAAEAHTWLLLHETVSLELPRRTQLGDFLSAISDATRGKGQDGRGLVIHSSPGALRAKAISLNTPVQTDARRAEIGDQLHERLEPLGLDVRVLRDGTVMLAGRDHGEGEVVLGADAFPEYRFSYSFVWNQWVTAEKDAARARRELEQARKATRP